MDDMSPEVFNAAMDGDDDMKFKVFGSDRKEYPLVPGGEKITINWANRKQFKEALRNVRCQKALFVVCLLTLLCADLSVPSARV